jgi:hypothetical protein
VSILSSLRDFADGDVINPALKRWAIFKTEAGIATSERDPRQLQLFLICSKAAQAASPKGKTGSDEVVTIYPWGY